MSVEHLSFEKIFSPVVPTVSSEGVMLSLPSVGPSFVASHLGAPFAVDASPSIVSSSSTPLKARVSSYDGDHKSQVKAGVNCREMGMLLVKELHPDLVLEHTSLSSTIFSSKGFKLPSGSAHSVSFDLKLLLQMTNTWNSTFNTWKYKPSCGPESQVAQWLNCVGADFSRVTSIPIVRKWVAGTCNTAVRGTNPETPLQCKPDIVLINVTSAHRTPTWDRIHAFGEVTTRPKFHSLMKQTVYTKTHLLFAAQESRRFVCSLAIYGKEMRLNVIDHEGIMYQKVSLEGGYENALTVIRIIASFMCGDSIALGRDPTIQLKPDGTVDTIMVNDESGVTTTYRVIRKLYAATGVIGRCTRVWQAHLLNDPAKVVVIKDTWPLVVRQTLEEEVLKKLKGVSGIPAVTVAVTVITSTYGGGRNFVDSTDLYRKAVSSTCAMSSRIHRRLVMSTVGLKLQNFQCLSELIGAFRDVIIGE